MSTLKRRRSERLAARLGPVRQVPYHRDEEPRPRAGAGLGHADHQHARRDVLAAALSDRRRSRERGLHEFDAWASTFGDTSTELEIQPSGKYKPVTRFAQLRQRPGTDGHVPLVRRCRAAGGLRDYVKVPGISGGSGRSHGRADPGLQGLSAASSTRGSRRSRCARGRREPGDDILLSVITDGRHAAIDLRLVDPASDNEPANKLNALIANAFRIWQETGEKHLSPPGRQAVSSGRAPAR